MTLSFGDLDFRRFRQWCLLFGILFANGSAHGQPGLQFGQIVGTVSNVSGQRLPGVSIILTAPEGDTRLTRVITDANGKYVLSKLRYGTYKLTASLIGFKHSEIKPLTVSFATETVDFTLTPLSGAEPDVALKSGSLGAAENHPPSFSPAGIQGTIAPSGYSSGLSGEETAQVMDRLSDLDQEVLSTFAPSESIADCNHETDLLNATKANPEAFGPNHALGVFYFGHGDLIQSIRYLNRAYNLAQSDTNNARQLALAFLGARQYPDAVSLLERITKKGKENPALLRLLAMAYDLAGARQRSVTEYLRAAGVDAGEENVFDCGIGLIGLGAKDAAAKLFTSATLAHPGFARLWLGLGIAQNLQQHKMDAIRSLQRAIDVDPEYFPPYSFLAGLSGASIETDTKIRMRLTVLVVAHPESALAHYDYALALWKQRVLSPSAASPAEIESQLRLALAMNPKMALAHFQLGVVYADSGDFVNAAAELRETVQLEPENAEAHYRLAQAYKRDRQAELADLEIKKFVTMHGNDARGEDGPEADVRKIASQLTRQITQDAPCHR